MQKLNLTVGLNQVNRQNISKVNNPKHAVLKFYTGRELGKTDLPDSQKYYCTEIKYFTSGPEALFYFINCPCENTQILSENVDGNLQKAIRKRKEQMNSSEWRKKHLSTT